MKKISLIVLIIFLANAALCADTLTSEEKSSVNGFYLNAMNSKELYVNLNGIGYGLFFQNNFYKFNKFKHFSKVKYLETSNIEAAECYMMSSYDVPTGYQCTYLATFADNSGVREDIPIKVNCIYGKTTSCRMEFKSEIEKQPYFYEKNPLVGYEKYSKWFKNVKNQTISLGMPEKMLVFSWGYPERIHQSVGSYGVHKQYVYGNSQYVYVENGVITSWQD